MNRILRFINAAALIVFSSSATFSFAPAEVCKSTDGWEKSGENASHVTITLTGDEVSWVPDPGWTILGICWKSGTEIQTEFGSWTSEVIRHSANGHDVSHASALLSQPPVLTPTSTLPAPTATEQTPEATATEREPDITPTNTATLPDPTATVVSSTQTSIPPTPTATLAEPTSTPLDPTPTEIPTDEPTATPTDGPPTQQPTPTDKPPKPTPTDPPQPTATLSGFFIPLTGYVEGQSSDEASANFEYAFPRLEIPSIGFQESVELAPREGQSWKLSKAPALLEGLSAIGVHNGYAGENWHLLAFLQAGTSLTWAGDIYVVTEIILVAPEEIEALTYGDLAIFTCQGFDWEKRLIIISERVVKIL